MKNITNLLSPIRLAVFALSVGMFASCSDNKNAGNMTPGNDGTARAIVGDDPNLAQPRPAPIGDTATTVEQMERFGAIPTNVNTANRQQRQLDSLKRAGSSSPTQDMNDNLHTRGNNNNTIGGRQ